MQEQLITQDIVYALSVAPDSSFWMAAKQSGLQRSNDGGLSWYAVIVNPEQDEQIQPSMTALAVAQGPDQELHLLVGVSGGMFISRDGGENWSPTAMATPSPFVTGLIVSPDYANDGIAFAASIEDGVFRTDDFGESWRAWCLGLFDLHVLGLVVSPDFALDGTVYALTESGIYRSRNRGRSWQLTGFPMDAAPVLCMAISSGFAQDGRFYAGTEAAGLYTSDDCGLSWQRMEQLEIEGSINAILLGTQNMLIFTGDSGWRSANAGLSWSRCYTDLDFGDGLTSALAPEGFASGKPLLLGLADGRILTIAYLPI